VSFSGAGTPDAHLLLSVPAGTVHDAWSTNTALRVMQAAADTDFEIEVKFESEPTRRYQVQGLLVEQDALNYLRFDVFSDGEALNVYSASFIDGAATVHIRESIPSAATIFLRLARAGNQWTARYSLDAMTWVTATSFSHALVVGSTGVFAGNFDPNPAYTAVVDYFFATSSPIVPEDGLLCDRADEFEIVTASIGEGSVLLDPVQSSYACGTVVTLAAEPDLGAMFARWDGAITENRTPVVFAIEMDMSVVASFVPDTSPPRIRNINVEANETSATVRWDADEPSIGRVEYGLTPLYELGSVASDMLATTHAVILPALVEDTHYHYRIIAEDSAGNSASSAGAVFTTTSSSGTGGPNIDVWYGAYQAFGQAGVPQRFINILGKVSDADGLSSLTYSLGGAPPLPLSVGPDRARLASVGDFNVEIAYLSLPVGVSAVTVRAVDGLGNETVEVVEVEYIDNVVTPETYSIDWSTVSDVSEVAQIVDGKWSLGSDGVRVVEPGYDRLIAIGDLDWVDYEATVEFTLNAPADPEDAPIVGLAMRWTGHFDWDGSQPRSGWHPLGALFAYTWITAPPYTGLTRWGSEGSTSGVNGLIPEPPVGIPHMLKMRGETLPSGDVEYSLKMWPVGQAEPGAWGITYVTNTPPPAGSLLLVAHYLDVTFGDIAIVPAQGLAPVSN